MKKRSSIVLAVFLFCTGLAGLAGAQCPVSVTPAGPLVSCGGSAMLHATSSSLYSYQWQMSPNGAAAYANITGATADTFLPTGSGYYRVVVNGPTSCTATSNAVQVTWQPLPNAVVAPAGPVCPGTTMCANPVSGAVYQWRLNGVAIAGATSVCYTPTVIGNYSVQVTNGTTGCTNTSNLVAVASVPPVINIVSVTGQVCPGGFAYFSNSVSGATSFSWTGPAGFASTQQFPVLSNATLSMAGVYTLTATNNCGSTSAQVTLAITCTDSVYPGDVNYDYVVDASDALDLALAYGYTGPVRSGASTVWTGQWCTNWAGLMPAATPTINRKHGDCNGDGTINSADLAAISLNYSQTHARGGFSLQQRVAGLPDLYFDLSGLGFFPGMTVNVPVMLGSPASPMLKLTGLKARIEVDGLQLTQALSMQPAASGWLGAPASLLSFEKTASGSNQIDWVLARTDRHTASGAGLIGYLQLKVPLNAVQFQPFVLRFRDVRMVDSSGQELTGYNVLSDTATVVEESVGGPAFLSSGSSIVPNPSSGAAVLRLYLRQDARVTLTVRDMSGRQVAAVQESLRAGAGSLVLPSEGLAAGSYAVSVLCDGVMAETVRWVKLR